MDWPRVLVEHRLTDRVLLDYGEEFGLRLALFLVDPRLDHKVLIESGTRTYAQQADLYWRWWAGTYKVSYVAVPGTSKHERGLAVDLHRVDPAMTWDRVHAVAADYGFHFPVGRNDPDKWERWHAELHPARLPLPIPADPQPEVQPQPVVFLDDEEDDMKGMQIIGDQGGVYAFFPGGVVISLGGMPDMHVQLNATDVAPVVLSGMPQAQLDEFARQWQASV